MICVLILEILASMKEDTMVRGHVVRPICLLFRTITYSHLQDLELVGLEFFPTAIVRNDYISIVYALGVCADFLHHIERSFDIVHKFSRSFPVTGDKNDPKDEMS